MENKTGKWTEYESNILKQAVKVLGDNKKWTDVSEFLMQNGVSRGATQCRHRWHKTMRPNLKKGPWNSGEDKLLTEAVVLSLQEVGAVGKVDWQALANQILPNRTGKACRERWISRLDPAIDRSPFSEDEDANLLACHQALGNKWAKIAKNMNKSANARLTLNGKKRSRTADQVKSRYISLMRRGKTSSHPQPRMATSQAQTQAQAHAQAYAQAQAHAHARAQAHAHAQANAFQHLPKHQHQHNHKRKEQPQQRNSDFSFSGIGMGAAAKMEKLDLPVANSDSNTKLGQSTNSNSNSHAEEKLEQMLLCLNEMSMSNDPTMRKQMHADLQQAKQAQGHSGQGTAVTTNTSNYREAEQKHTQTQQMQAQNAINPIQVVGGGTGMGTDLGMEPEEHMRIHMGGEGESVGSMGVSHSLRDSSLRDSSLGIGLGLRDNSFGVLEDLDSALLETSLGASISTNVYKPQALPASNSSISDSASSARQNPEQQQQQTMAYNTNTNANNENANGIHMNMNMNMHNRDREMSFETSLDRFLLKATGDLPSNVLALDDKGGNDGGGGTGGGSCSHTSVYGSNTGGSSFSDRISLDLSIS